MSNTILTNKSAPGIVAKLAAEMLADKVQFVKAVDKEDNSVWGKNYENAQPGDTIYVNKPARFTVGTNADITSAIQDVIEEKAALPLDQRSVVAVALTSAEIATDLAMKNWAKRILDPAMSAIAQNIEQVNILKATQGIYNLAGTAGTTPASLTPYLDAGELLDYNLAPRDDRRKVLINPRAQNKTVDGLKGLFQASDEIKKQYKQAVMGTAAGFDFLSNNLLARVANGNDVTGVAVEATVLAPATGATQIGVDGLTANTGTVAIGSVFTIAGVYDVHPITKATLPNLKQFVATASVTAGAGGDALISISPTIYSSASGSLQNVSALPVDEAALVFVGLASTTYAQNLAFHPSFYRYASVPLVLPDGTNMSARETVDGMSVRVIQDYTVLTDKMVMRLDVLGGGVLVRAEWGARVIGEANA
jgi:hypothetical protein